MSDINEQGGGNEALENEYLPYQPPSYYEHNQLKLINSINAAYERSLTDKDPRAETPPLIKIPLKPHQAAIVQGMEAVERGLRSGLPCPDGSTLYSRYAVLGDAVGAGKSLAVLAHIARMKTATQMPSPAYYHKHSTPHMYSTWSAEPATKRSATLILVPHSLYLQWTNYITSQTTLNVALCKSRIFLRDEKAAADKMVAADAVLVSNTLYEEVQAVAAAHNVHWERIFVDEVDSIHIPRGRTPLHAEFVWFISATWIPCISAQAFITSSTIGYHIANGDINLDTVHVDFKSNYLAQSLQQYTAFIIDSRWQSMTFFAPFLNKHPNRYMLILRTADEFRKQSLELPPMQETTIRCRNMLQNRIAQSVLPADVSEMIHAGDISGALAHLGVPVETPLTLIDAVTRNQQRELHRLEATLEFKKGLDYSSAALKEAAIATLEQKITSLKDQIETFRSRIAAIDEDNCAICYEKLTNTVCVPCCKQLFCGACILQTVKHNPKCPMCRSHIEVGQLHAIKKTKGVAAAAVAVPEAQLLPKPETLLKLIQDNPTGRFIVFSRYDNPFGSIEALLTGAGIAVAHMKGNKDVIHTLIEKFRSGSVRVLLLNSEHFATGMNLEAATHVVLYHGNMSPNERQQIIGRAHRLGRTGPLTVVQLLHDNEVGGEAAQHHRTTSTLHH
jgi:hypothetical protein